MFKEKTTIDNHSVGDLRLDIYVNGNLKIGESRNEILLYTGLALTLLEFLKKNEEFLKSKYKKSILIDGLDRYEN